MKDTKAKGPRTTSQDFLKKYVYCDVISRKYVIDISKRFTEHADKAFKGITSFYLHAEDVLIEPVDIKVSPNSHG